MNYINFILLIINFFILIFIFIITVDVDVESNNRSINLENLDQHLSIINEHSLHVTDKKTVDDIIRSCENESSMISNKLIII